MPDASSPRTVLLTGISGFLGSATALEFLRRGWKVRGTLRSQDKADGWLAKYPEYASQLSFALVPDLAADGAFDEAIKGVDAVAHIASPFTFQFEDNERDLLIPALKGTTSVLAAAAATPSVKNVVITSSLAAAQDPAKGLDPDFIRTSEVWSPFMWEEAVKYSEPHLVYLASKTFAERAAWDFVKEKQPSFTMSTIVPPIILGRSLQPLSSLSELKVSASVVRNIIDAEKINPTAVPVFVNVLDCARAHVEAVERGMSNRYLLIGGDNDYEEIARILREEFPEQAHRIPTQGTPLGPHWGFDCSPAKQELGIEFTDLRTTIKQAGEQLFRLEKEFGAAKKQ
ncbi:hypothetical protein JCM6882_009301 [Rhodosporidiobolus microsporus]